MIVRGLASSERKNDRGRVVRLSGLAASIAARGAAGIRLLIQHNEALPAGRILKLDLRPGGLWCEAELDPELPGVRRFIELIRRRAPGIGFSIGIHDCGFGRLPDRTIEIKSGDLREISIAQMPRNADCKFLYPSGWGADVDEDLAARVGMARPLILPPIRYHEQEIAQ